VKLTLTLLVRDEEDIIADILRYHLAQGVDEVIVTDNLSIDSTPDILDEFERVTVIREDGDDYSQARWVTRMARLAYSRGADWVINGDADEFWWPEEGDLKETLGRVPGSASAVTAPRVNFVPVRSTGRPAATMTVREVCSSDLLGDPLQPKVAHRASPDVRIAQGNSAVTGIAGDVIEAPIVIFHYPMRSLAQFDNKIKLGGAAYARNIELPEHLGYTWRRLYELRGKGKLADYFESHVHDPDRIAAGIASGDLVEDRRLADFLTGIGGGERPGG
jgi:hypothetical protein